VPLQFIFHAVEKANSRKPNIKQLVQKYVIDNWESQDEPEHLRTIRDRILWQRFRKIIFPYLTI
jgi:hypothetical protein